MWTNEVQKNHNLIIGIGLLICLLPFEDYRRLSPLFTSFHYHEIRVVENRFYKTLFTRQFTFHHENKVTRIHLASFALPKVCSLSPSLHKLCFDEKLQRGIMY
jgi:hypothetical protein